MKDKILGKKNVLVKLFAEANGLTIVEGKKLVDSLLNLIEYTVISSEKKQLVLTGWGRFFLQKRSARVIINPQDRTKKIHVPESYYVKFKAGKNFKEHVQRVVN